MSLSPRASKSFVVVFVVVLLGLSILATVLIVRGWNDSALQDEVQRLEDARN